MHLCEFRAGVHQDLPEQFLYFLFVFRIPIVNLNPNFLDWVEDDPLRHLLDKVQVAIRFIKLYLRRFFLHPLCNLYTPRKLQQSNWIFIAYIFNNISQPPKKFTSHFNFLENIFVRYVTFYNKSHMYNSSRTPNISHIIYAHDAAYLIGFPELTTVEQVSENTEEFYEQKIKPTINMFRMFPKMGMKSTSKLTGSLGENIALIAGQYEYQEDYEPQGTASHSKKKLNKTTSSSETVDGTPIKKHPLYRLYSPANPVLKEEYTILTLEQYKKITNKEEEEIAKEKIRDWIDIGYHIHVAQAFKVEQSHGKLLIFLEKLKGKTLRDFLEEGFFSDKNKYLNSKRLMNCFLQIAVGLNYIHKRGYVHQSLIPDNIYVENERILKIGNMCHANLVMSKIAKNFCIGGSPEYWSYEQGSMYSSLQERAREGTYLQSMKLLPVVSNKSDLYQLGLILVEMLFSRRLWARGDRLNFGDFQAKMEQSNCNKQTTAFVIDKFMELVSPKPEDRKSLFQLIPEILDFYAKNFRNAEDLLWCRFFDEEKYQSDLLNNKAVGLYLSGNEAECEKAWMKSVNSNPQNLTAQFNFSHFKRMKRIIDDKRLNKDLMLQPECRKRNYYLLISNLVMLPLLKQPFKTYNFNPKLSKQKEIEVLSNIIETLDKFKKPKDFYYMKKHHLLGCRFDQAYIVESYLVGRVKGTNIFHAFNITEDVKAHTFLQIKSMKEPTQNEGRQAFSNVDPTNSYLAMSDNSYLCIFKIKPIENSEIYLQIGDYGSSITTLCFDQKSEVLGVGSSEFTIKLINLVTKNIHKVINIGQKFIIKNLSYYDRNTCIGYSYERAITFHRIQTAKQLFQIKTSALIVNFNILEISLSSHLLIAHTTEKFQIWNIKDKVLLRNIEIDEAPKIQGFFTNSAKKLVVHFTKNVLRIWNYSNGLILKTYRSPIPYLWIHLDPEAKYLRSLDAQGNLVTRYIDFSDFIKYFEGVCVPNEICLTDQREQYSEEIGQYVTLGRQLIQNLNEYRLNEQQKKVSLEKMYRLGETIKNTFFFQDKEDIKTIFVYLNGVRQSEDRSSKINSHSEENIFTSHKDDFITATSNFLQGCWLLGDSQGTIRLVSAPDAVHMSIKPRAAPVLFLNLQPTSIFIGYHSACLLLERDSLNIVVQHSTYHKKPVRMGLVLSSILVTGDQDQMVLFWNKDKVRRYQIPVNRGDIVGRKLIVAGFDNRIRIYDVHSESGLQKLHVFVGHVMNIYNLTVIDDGIFTSSSYDGTIRWWNIQVRSCFSFFNFKKYFRNDKILCVDMPKFSLEEERHPKFNREGNALILLNASEIVVFDTMRKEVKWRIELAEEVTKVFWTNYPNTFAAVTHEECIVYNIYWRYMILKK